MYSMLIYVILLHDCLLFTKKTQQGYIEIYLVLCYNVLKLHEGGF